MKIMKKVSLILSAIIAGITVTSCGASNDSITVVSREEGSGTRGAFIELFGIEQKDADGNKVDYTTDEAETISSTSVMLTTIAGNKNAIGYVSLGSLDTSKVKALKIDGTEATGENVKNGTYKISRPFNIATKDDLGETAQDFVNFILSKEGQKIVEQEKFIPLETSESYTSSNMSGKVIVAGSTSVAPVMEKLKEAYIAINPDVTIELSQSDSTTGMTSTVEGICDIGMASRDLKTSELEKGLTSTVIALDGIAVIVNKDSSVDTLTSEQVKNIYTGEVTAWSEING